MEQQSSQRAIVERELESIQFYGSRGRGLIETIFLVPDQISLMIELSSCDADRYVREVMELLHCDNYAIDFI